MTYEEFKPLTKKKQKEQDEKDHIYKQAHDCCIQLEESEATSTP